jgi:hypothetical protein
VGGGANGTPSRRIRHPNRRTRPRAISETGNIAEQEERFAMASLRLLGVEDSLAVGLFARSRELVAESGITEPKPRRARQAKKTASS